MAFGSRRPRSSKSLDGDGALEENVIKIDRYAKVVKGGPRFSFGVLVVVGDRQGHVGLGYGKANAVPLAVDKGIADAKKSMIDVPIVNKTIPHTVKGHCGASCVVMVPASEGTGVMAGKMIRPLLELAGIHNVLTKAYGSTTPRNLLKAGIDALEKLRTAETISKLRGVKIG